MIDKELRDLLPEYCSEDAIIFDEPSYDKSIIGVDDNGRIIYSYDLMIEELMNDYKITEENARDVIDNDTLCSMAGFEGVSPIILYSIYR